MLDWMMPGMDGPTLFRKMKQDPEAAKLPGVTDLVQVAELREALGVNFRDAANPIENGLVVENL